MERQREKTISEGRIQKPIISKIGIKLLVLFYFVTVIPLFIIIAAGFSNYSETVNNQAIDSLLLSAEIQEGKLVTYLEKLVSDTNRYAQSSRIVNYVIEYNSNPTSSENGSILQRNIQSILADNQNIIAVSLVDSNGIVISSSEYQQIGRDLSKEEYLIESKAKRSGYIGDIDTDFFSGTNRTVLPIVATITNSTEAASLGTLIVYYDVQILSNVLLGLEDTDISLLTRQGGRRETVDIYLVNSENLMISDSRFFGSEVILQQPVNTQPVTECRKNTNEITGKWLDYRGESVLGASMCIPSLHDWVLLVEIDEQEVKQDIFDLRFEIMLLSIFFVIAVLAAAVYFSHRIISPLLLLNEYTKQIARGKTKVDITINSDDEIGELARNFEVMADSVLLSQEEIEENLELVEQQKEKVFKQQKAVLNVLDDVETEKKRSELLANDLRKFKQAVDNASDMVIILGEDSSIIYANSATSNKTGYPVDEIIGSKYDSIWGDGVDESLAENLWAMVTKKENDFSVQIHCASKAGDEYDLVIDASPITADDGSILFVVLIARDITKEKQVDQAKTEFVSLASHQLRTPLSSINWFVQMLLDEDAGKINDEQRDLLEEVFDGNKRMIDLVNSLLNVSRIELGTFAVEPENAQITEIADSVIEEISVIASAKNLTLSKEYGEDIPEIPLDTKLTRIIVQNLVSNAVKYTPARGTVIVRIQKNKKNLIVEVEDTGYGIPADQQSKMFTKLFRADNVKAQDTTGTGLGLYIIKSIIETAGGAISFVSTENVGTTFTVEIPITGMTANAGSKPLEE